LKIPAEILYGKSAFPDVFNMVNIRDRGTYLAQAIGLGDLYKYVTGKPSKPGFEFLDPRNLIMYKADRKKVAYDSVNSMVRKYLEEIGKSTKGYSENARSEVLYYYKQAIRLKDKKAEKKYFDKYFKMGGTKEGFKEGLKNLHPLSGLTAPDRAGFLKQLTPKERVKVDLAIEHYKDFMQNVGK
jgi:hypothetical protein